MPAKQVIKPSMFLQSCICKICVQYLLQMANTGAMTQELCMNTCGSGSYSEEEPWETMLTGSGAHRSLQ